MGGGGGREREGEEEENGKVVKEQNLVLDAYFHIQPTIEEVWVNNLISQGKVHRQWERQTDGGRQKQTFIYSLFHLHDN